MPASGNLPSLSLGDSSWDDTPPNPLTEPGYYEGLIWRRVIGFAVDAMLVWSLNLAIWVAGILTLGLLWPVLAVVIAILPFAYHTYFLGRYGATPGMSLFDVELRAWNGNRLDYPQAFLQTALFYTTVPMTSGLILVVSLFNDRRRTLHDILSATLAVRRSFLHAAAAA